MEEELSRHTEEVHLEVDLMEQKNREQLLRSEFSGELDRDTQTIRALLNVPPNEDAIFRPYMAGGLKICLIYIEGLSDDRKLSEFVLHAMKHVDAPLEGISAQKFRECVLELGQARLAETFEALIPRIVAGMGCILVDGCREAIYLESRAYPQRPVGAPLSESVVEGSHEGFNENLRTNISLIRRYLQSPELTTQMLTVGTRIPTQVAVVYLNGTANKNCVNEVMKRLKSIQSGCVRGTGAIQQLIEDHPFALLPQMLQTERPDRAASCISDGQIAILAENSPFALIAPVTIFHLIHASDDSFLRWQYGSALRCIRLLGMLVSLLLPALYVAVSLHHAHLLPMELLSSIAEARANVPFPVIVEVLFMELSFYLLNEAGLRTPSGIGSAFGIIGALVLGQAAVSAGIISPILIIIISLTGLGNYVVPNYGFGIGVVLYRLGLIILGAMLGFYGIMIGLFLLFTQLCSMKSFGVDYLSPVAPNRRHNPDILLRMPSWMQKRIMFFASPRSWTFSTKEEAHD